MDHSSFNSTVSQHEIIQPLSTKKTSQTILQSLNSTQLTIYKIGAGFSYILAYVYVLMLWENRPTYYFPLSLVFVACIETGITDKKRSYLSINNNTIETNFFLFTTLAQALSLTIWGYGNDEVALFQFIMIHISFVFYVLARSNWLSQERLGILVWYDFLTGFFKLPFSHLFLRLSTLLFHSTTRSTEQFHQKRPAHMLKFFSILAISIGLTIYLVTFVGGQLIQVSNAFANTINSIYLTFLDTLNLFHHIDVTLLFLHWLFSLPIGAWLFGLIAGSILKRPEKRLNYQIFQNTLIPFRVFPPFTAYLLIGSLCFIYLLFFAVGISQIAELLSLQGISPQHASSTAVSGFWQLVRVSLLNFAVLGGFYLVGRQPLWEQKTTRWLVTLLFIFTSLLALLAAWKLFAIYIFFYGPTPLRLLSGWFILVLLVWCGLTIIRFFRHIQAIRYGIFYAVFSFTMLSYIYHFIL